MEKVTLHYTEYSTRSYRSYYGPKSFTVKKPRRITVATTRETEKALQLTLIVESESAVNFHMNGATCWVPKSAVSKNPDGSIAIKPGFVYYSGWPQWNQVKR